MENSINCSICDKPFQRLDIEYVELGKTLPKDLTLTRLNPQTGENETIQLNRSFYACHACAMQEKLTWYRVNFEQAKENNERLKTENNLFRTLMLKVETMQGMSEGEKAISVKSYIMQQRPGWEALSLDSIELFLDLYRAHTETFASLYNKKASKEEIKARLQKSSEEAKASDIKRQQAEKVKANGGLKGTYTDIEKKAVQSLMKQFKISEEKAVAMMKSMLANAKA